MGATHDIDASTRTAAAADRHPLIANLKSRDVFANAFDLYRRQPARVLLSALVLLAPGLVLGIGSGIYLDRISEDTATGRFVAAVIVAVVAGILSTLGTVTFAGVLDVLVGALIRGLAPPALKDALKLLPVWRLIGADLLVVLLVGVGVTLGVIPGLIALAMLSIVGPVVNIERLGPWRSVRRSFRLTSRHIPLTLITAGIPLTLEVLADDLLLHIDGVTGAWIQLLVSLPVIFTIGAMVGLAEVVLAYALLAREPGSSVAAMVEATAPTP